MADGGQTGVNRLSELKARLGRVRQTRRFAGGAGAALLLMSVLPIGFALLGIPPFTSLIHSQFDTLFYGYLVILTPFFFIGAALAPVRSIEYEIQEIEDENDLQRMSEASHEQKAYKLLRIQQSQLTRFLSVILTQSKTIFFVGLFAMLVGVGVIIFAILQTRGANDTEKWVVGVLGAVGAILTNFVAAIYIRMFGDIGGAVKDAVAMLAKSSNINFANVLVAKIQDDNAVRNGAYKELAVSIVSKT